MSSSVRNYNSISTVKHIGGASEISGSATTIPLADGETTEDFPGAPFTVVLEPGVVGKEEIVTVTSKSSSSLTVTRGEDGTTGKSHVPGVEIRHMATGRDFQNSRDHIDSSENVHGIADTAYLVTLNGTQTLQNKTLTSPSINGGDSLTATSTELNYVDGVTSAIQTQLDAKASSSHVSATTSVHGIADTSALATKTYADSAVSTHGADTTSVHGIADTSKLTSIASASAGRTIFVQSAQPTALATGDIWFQVTGL